MPEAASKWGESSCKASANWLQSASIKQQCDVYSFSKAAIDGKACLCSKEEIELSLSSHTENLVEIIKFLLKDGSGYISATYIARTLRLNVNEIRNTLSNSGHFRKSFLKTDSGQDVYMVKSPLCILKDFWNTICYINYRMQ